MFQQTLDITDLSTRDILKVKRDQKLIEHHKKLRNQIFQEKRILMMDQNRYQNSNEDLHTIKEIIEGLQAQDNQLQYLNFLIRVFEQLGGDKNILQQFIQELYDANLMEYILIHVQNLNKQISKQSIYLLSIFLQDSNDLMNRSFLRKKGDYLLERILNQCNDIQQIQDVIKFINYCKILCCLGNTKNCSLSDNFRSQTLPQIYQFIISQETPPSKLIDTFSWFIVQQKIHHNEFYLYQFNFLVRESNQNQFYDLLCNITQYTEAYEYENEFCFKIFDELQIMRLLLSQDLGNYLLFAKILEFIGYLVEKSVSFYEKNKNDILNILELSTSCKKQLVEKEALILMVKIVIKNRELPINIKIIESFCKIFAYSQTINKLEIVKFVKIVFALNNIICEETVQQFFKALDSNNFAELLVSNHIENSDKTKKFLETIALFLQSRQSIGLKLRKNKFLKQNLMQSPETSPLINQILYHMNCNN